MPSDLLLADDDKRERETVLVCPVSIANQQILDAIKK